MQVGMTVLRMWSRYSVLVSECYMELHAKLCDPLNASRCCSSIWTDLLARMVISLWAANCRSILLSNRQLNYETINSIPSQFLVYL